MKLRLWVKIVITLLIGIVGLLIYKHTGTCGALAQGNKFYLLVCLLEWSYLFFGQIGLLYFVWDN